MGAIAPGVMKNRVIYYHSKLHCEQMKSGENFSKMQAVVNIIICDHLMLDEEIAYLNSYSLRNDLSHRLFTDLTRMIILELPKLPETDDGTAPWPWLRFFTCKTPEELEMLVKEHPEVREAAATLRKISFRERWQRAAFLRDKWRRDVRMWKADARAEGLTEGLAEGRIEGRVAECREVARKMKASGYSTEQIIELTGFSPEEIRIL
jgi:predicted transposase/invertase (TIGR01784 family)